MIVLNITTASHGLRPPALARLVRTPTHRIQTPTEVFPQNNLVDLRQRLVLGVQPGIPLRKIKKSYLTHEHPSRCQQIVNPILNRRCAKMAFLEVPITSMALPCVLLLEGRRSCVLTRIEQGSSAEIALPDMGAGSRSVPIAELESEYIGYALFARPEFQFDTRSEDIRTADPKGWFWGTLVSSWKIYVEVVIAALLVNSFALASPLFIMNVYDRVVPNAAIETLWVLALGAATVFGFDFLLKMLRSYFVDVAGKTADTPIGARLFQQVLGMKMADRPASAGALASNLREFEHLRDFFTSSTLTAIVDFSFALLFIFIISIIGGAKIALIPLVAMLPIMIVGMIVQIPLRQISQQSFRESAQKHSILVEAITGIETIKTTASEGRMQRAWETFSAVTSRTGMKAQTFSAFAVNFSAFSIQLVTIGVVIMGVFLIRDGELTVGALVASTMLTGRAMAPLSQIAAIPTRFNQSRAALAALDVLMKTPVDRPWTGSRFVSRPKRRRTDNLQGCDFHISRSEYVTAR